jgi:hypothetical protein
MGLPPRERYLFYSKANRFMRLGEPFWDFRGVPPHPVYSFRLKLYYSFRLKLYHRRFCPDSSEKNFSF